MVTKSNEVQVGNRITTNNGYVDQKFEIYSETMWVSAEVRRNENFTTEGTYEIQTTVNVSASGSVSIEDAKRMRDMLDMAIANAEEIEKLPLEVK